MIFRAPLIAVKNIEVSKRFYHDLLDQEVIADLGANVTLSGGIALQEKFDILLGISEDSIKYHGNDAELYFETDDIDSFLKRIDSKDVHLVHPPKRHEWGQMVVRFYDPDGHIIEVGESIVIVAKRIFSECGSEEETARLMSCPMNVIRYWLNS